MGRREQVKRSAEQKWEILQEGLKSGNVAETCRKHGAAPNLWYRWRDEAEQGAKAALGDTETESWAYNNRGWLTTETASLGSSPNYSLSLASYAPNGNVLAANDSVNGNWTYSYDAFNRLVGANQNSGAAIYSYVYDLFGNRWQQNGPIFNSVQFTGNGTNNTNRVDGKSYDTAGNMTGDGTYTYTYDAENRLISVVGGSTNATYLYDAFGNRVKKTGNSTECGSNPIYYLYDLSGRIADIVPSSGTDNCHDEIYAGSRNIASYIQGSSVYNHSDWLGTQRFRAGHTGTAAESCTSLPFGDYLVCNPSEPSYVRSPLHFTGKERDSESGLDNFGKRYFGSTMGRFMTPDPLLNSGQPWNPQSWNRYAYTENNPLRYTDPTGLYKFGSCSGTDDQCQADRQRYRDSIAKANEALKGLVTFTPKTSPVEM